MCHYHARVAGGVEKGVHCAVQTILCRDCRELHDVITRRQAAEGEQPPRPGLRLMETPQIPPLLLVRQPFRMLVPKPARAVCRAMPSPLQWLDLKAVCPVAAVHRVETWQNPGRCPRCGTYLERNLVPWREWD